MQSLHDATNSPGRCATAIVETVPPIVWFIRRHMRGVRSSLSVPQFRALVLAGRKPQLSLSCLAENLGASLPAVSRLVNGLVKRGFLKRDASETDRRQVSLGLTSRGEQVVRTAWQSVQETLAVKLGDLDAHQRTILVEAMAILQSTFAPMGSSKHDGQACPLNGHSVLKREAKPAGRS